MGGITHLGTIQISLIIFCFCAGFAEAERKARLSYSLANAVCMSADKFTRTSQIQPPFKSPPINDDLCKTLMWNNCDPGATGACLKFKLKNCHSHSQDNHNKASKKMSRIVNGVDAIPHEFPHMVHFTENGSHFCGGTILNANYIVTAAHCIKPYFIRPLNNKIEVIAGEHSLNMSDGTEQFRNIKSAVWHENFGNGLQNDIALVLLDKPLEFNEYVFPPKMPEADYEATGQQGTIKGWGLLYDYGPLPDILQKANMTILSDSECAVLYSGISKIQDTNVCATSDDVDKHKDICNGDSGSPLTVKVDNDCEDNRQTSDLFIGIASYGLGCQPPHVGVYTQVSKYIDWIHKCSQPLSGGNFGKC